MKKINAPFVIGSIILILIMFVVIFPESITKTNPYNLQGVKFISTAGSGMNVKGAPFPPSKEAPLGTDKIGRDVLSILVYGTRLTMSLALLIAAARFLVAIPIGMFAGFGSNVCKTIINQFNILFSVVPALIFSIIVLKLGIFTSLFKKESIMAFIVILTLVGWAKLASIIEERVENILHQPFIRGEVAVGKSNFQIALTNILPHLAAELIILFFMEIALALAMIMQLAIFDVFIGNTKIVEDSDGDTLKVMNISFEPEWSSMLSTSKYYITTAPWVVFSPAISFLISIFGFNLFGEGLRIMLQKKDSKFIVNLRRLFSFNKTISEKKKIRKTAAVAMILLLIIVTSRFTLFKGDTIKAVNGKSILNYSFSDEVIVGSDEAKDLSNNLEKALKDIGFKPLNEGKYIQEYELGSTYAPSASKFELVNSKGAVNLEHGKDYSFFHLGNYKLTGNIYNGTNLDLYSIKDFKQFDDKFILIDSSSYSRESLQYFSEVISKNSTAKGMICALPSKEVVPYSVSNYNSNFAVVYVSSRVAAMINENTKLNISLESKKCSGKGRNVLGILPGENGKVGKEAIVIGFGYNYNSQEKAVINEKILMALELGKKLKENKENRNRSIILAFWDGTIYDEYNGLNYFARHTLYSPADLVLYIDLTQVKAQKDRCIYINSEETPLARYFAWAFNHQLEMDLKGNNVEVVNYKNFKNKDEILVEDDIKEDLLYYESGVPTIFAAMKPGDEGSKKDFTLDDLGTVLYKTITKNNK